MLNNSNLWAAKEYDFIAGKQVTVGAIRIPARVIQYPSLQTLF